MADTLRVFVLPTTRRHAHLPRWMLPGAAHDGMAVVCSCPGSFEDLDFGGHKPLCLNCLRQLNGRINDWQQRIVETAVAEFSDWLGALTRGMDRGE